MSAERTARPAATKRPRVAAPFDQAQRALRRFLDPAAAADGPPTEELLATAITHRGTGTHRPVPEDEQVVERLHRTFAFLDICGFTAYTDRNGPLAATEVLRRFRAVVRDVSVRRGVRVGKWLGDGVMLVGPDPGPTVAAVAELTLRLANDPFEVHGGLAGGTVLLFEGDDYIGRPVNLAARLCEAAGPNELLAAATLAPHLPEWVDTTGTVTVRANGIGDVDEVLQLAVGESAWDRGWDDGAVLPVGLVDAPAADGSDGDDEGVSAGAA